MQRRDQRNQHTNHQASFPARQLPRPLPRTATTGGGGATVDDGNAADTNSTATGCSAWGRIAESLTAEADGGGGGSRSGSGGGGTMSGSMGKTWPTSGSMGEPAEPG